MKWSRAGAVAVLASSAGFWMAQAGPVHAQSMERRVKVVNGPSEPVPTRAMEQSLHETFARHTVVDLPPGTTNAVRTVVCVPAGKRLVVENFSGLASLPSGQDTLGRLVVRSGTTQLYQLFLAHTSEFSSSGWDLHVAVQRLHLYIDAGQCIAMWALRSADTESGAYEATLTGYYVDAPPAPLADGSAFEPR